MRRQLRIVTLVLVGLLVGTGRFAQAKDLRSLKVLYVGDPATERGRAIDAFLREHVAEAKMAERRGFDPASAAPYDVVVFDWPQGEETREMRKLKSPLGAREAWGRPTVLLGSAGLNLAVAWQLKGGSGCTCMDPQAYGLRDHEIFDGPFKIDRGRMVSIPTPKDFQEEIKDPTVRVLPLVDDVGRNWRPGWCTYDYDFATHPDVEFFSGGVNHKTPTAAGLWRQGNLLHFGFEPSPAEMNETGRNLLLNSIAYISRFSEDRPIARTPSVFAGKVAPARASVVRRARNPEYPLDATREALSPRLREQVAGKDRAALIAWAEAEAKWLYSNADKQLDMDEDLRALGVPFEQGKFLDTVERLLRGTPDEQATGRRLAARYLPDLPHGDAGAAAAWLAENRPYLFASDTGDYRWYVDPLAKRRGVPSAELRGARRADAAPAAVGVAR